MGSKTAVKNSAQTDRQTDTTKIMVTWPWTNIYICGIHSFVSRRLRLPPKSEEFAHPSVPKGTITASRHLKYSFLLILRQKMSLFRIALDSKLCEGDLLSIETNLACLSERQGKRTSAIQQLSNVKQFKHETGLMDNIRRLIRSTSSADIIFPFQERTELYIAVIMPRRTTRNRQRKCCIFFWLIS